MKIIVAAISALVLVSRADKTFVAAPKPSMDKKQAELQCFKTGRKLVSYRDIKANPSAPEYLNKLGSGESAWIEGFAKISPFLSWQGCFNKTRQSIHAVANEGRSVYVCWKTCLQYNKALFIGLRNISCYCIALDQRYQIQNGIVDDSLCSTSCANNVLDTCGGTSYMSVYGILDERQIHLDMNKLSTGLCVYVKRYGSRFNVYTASCHSYQTLTVNGYICTDGARKRLSATTSNCTEFSNIRGTYCIVEEMSTRQAASEGCRNRGGILADLGAEKTMPPYMGHNYKYWIGIYRTFRISEMYISSKTVCLSVTKVDNLLYLEPDDCSAQKYYLCKATETDGTVTVSTTTLDSGLHDNNKTLTTTTLSSDTGLGTNGESPLPYILPSVLIVIFVLLIILFVVYRRHRKRRKLTPRIVQDNYDAIYEIDNVRNEQSVSSDTGLNADSKCLIAKSKPNKPERQTLKRKTLGTEYENFTLKGNSKDAPKKNEKTKEGNGDVGFYDKINFNSKTSKVSDAYGESNVYSHMTGNDSDNYDTMRSTKSLHSIGRVDNAYSRMKDGIILNDYCDLAKPCETRDGKQYMDNSLYNLTPEQHDEVVEVQVDKPRRFIIVDDYEDGFGDGFDKTKSEKHENSEIINYTEIARPEYQSDAQHNAIYHDNVNTITKHPEADAVVENTTDNVETDSVAEEFVTKHTSSYEDIDSKYTAGAEQVDEMEAKNKARLNYIEVDPAEVVEFE